jgi:hypothetical protein
MATLKPLPAREQVVKMAAPPSGIVAMTMALCPCGIEYSLDPTA